ncbi:MAG: ion transporter [Cytophagaceae bacterium]|nr:ion transporter [Cytophagaceae bacterium]
MSNPNKFINTLIDPLENFRKNLFTILVAEKNTHPTGRLFNFLIVTLIFLNVTAIILETVEVIYYEFEPYFDTLEIYTLTIFTLEYCLQLWICTLNKKYSHPIWGRLKFALTPMAIIELLVILPLLISMFSEYDFRFFTIFRFFMVLRIFKLDKYSEALETFRHVILDKKEELFIIFLTIIMLLILTSTGMYFIEKDENPEFSSIPETMWWAASALMTVGYGDVIPITPAGKIFGSIIALLGIAMFAVPAGLISSSFTEYVQSKRKKKSCPHCNKEL